MFYKCAGSSNAELNEPEKARIGNAPDFSI